MIAFNITKGKFRMVAEYKKKCANVSVYENDVLLIEREVESYKVFNYGAHFQDIIDDILASREKVTE